MSDRTQPRDLTLERIDRLSQSLADLMESHATQGRNINRLLDLMGQHLNRIETQIQILTAEVHGLASDQVLMANRVEDAFSRALRTNIRLDEIEDTANP